MVGLFQERVQLAGQTSSVTDISGLSQNLLEEKNQEIDHLSEQVLRLQTEYQELQAEKGVERMVGYNTVRIFKPGCVGQLVMCLATDACLTSDPGIPSLIPARSHTFVEIDHEMISTVILMNHSRRVVVSCERKYVHQVLVNGLFKLAQEKVW